MQAAPWRIGQVPNKENPEMKQYTKLCLLVLLALLLTLTACQRPASRPPVATPTTSGEVPFPFETTDPVSAIRTQTAVAQNPLVQPTNTVGVQVATATAEPEGAAGEQPAAEQPAPAATQPDPEAGGGQAAAIPEVTRPETYTLQRGEWPICIARRYNLELSSFLAANGMNMNSKPAAGTVLRIPSSGSWSANHGQRSLRSHPTTYTVAGGDSIYSIACHYGDVAPEQILAANNLSNASEISAGMQIQIP
jgi:LysM repeat protein